MCAEVAWDRAVNEEGLWTRERVELVVAASVLSEVGGARGGIGLNRVDNTPALKRRWKSGDAPALSLYNATRSWLELLEFRGLHVASGVAVGGTNSSDCLLWCVSHWLTEMEVQRC